MFKKQFFFSSIVNELHLFTFRFGWNESFIPFEKQIDEREVRM